jgi:hypothetical protein
MGTWGIPAVIGMFGFGRVTRFRACLAGHTLIADGYQLNRKGIFVRGREHVRVDEVAVTAKESLGLSHREYYNPDYHSHREGSGRCNLFCGRARQDEALERFLQLIEEEERRRLAAA